jgi:putative endonuclease
VNQSKKDVGQYGEDRAAEHIQQAGLSILDRNYRCPHGEMDIIASEGTLLVFIEVRTRSSGRFGWGEESVTSQKRTRLHRIATHYIKYMGYKDWPPIRFDLVAIRVAETMEKQPDICWIRGI